MPFDLCTAVGINVCSDVISVVNVFQYEEIDGYGLRNILSYKSPSTTAKLICCEGVEKSGKYIQCDVDFNKVI